MVYLPIYTTKVALITLTTINSKILWDKKSLNTSCHDNKSKLIML